VRAWFDRRVVSVWRRAQAARTGGDEVDARAAAVLVLMALILTAQHYYGDQPFFKKYVYQNTDNPHYALWSLGWWAGAKLIGYFLIPAFIVTVGFRARLRDYGLSTDGIVRHLWIYGAIFGAILPIVVIASFTQSFQTTYPFYKWAARSWFDFIVWELMYGATFFALEFFFRGFLLFGLERAIGAYAIFVMAVPYCMIHFDKPVPEVVGAIFAGIALGTLALATRSIWYGVLVHVSVAWTMDALAMWHVWGWPGSGRFVSP
jgi:CAAX protease family protein